MKNKILTALALSILLVNASGISNSNPLKGDSYTAFGQYRVALSSEPLIIKGKEYITYDLIYSNLHQVVKIAIDSNKKCKKFIVKYPSFEMQYNCTRKGFGVKRMDRQYESINPDIVSAVLDAEQFMRQEVIVSEARADEELLHLIACYFPCLLNKKIRDVMEDNS